MPQLKNHLQEGLSADTAAVALEERFRIQLMKE